MSTSGPTVSVITPSFHQLEWLKLCAASIADQSGPVEHIIQDGGSGDEFDEWAKEHQFSRCYRESDNGMYDAINRGFLRAKGEILCWLNCDEQYLPGTIERVISYMAKNPEVDILCGDIIMLDSALKPICYRRAVRPSRAQIRWNFLPSFSAATFIRRRIIDEGHLLDDSFKAIADAEWIYRLLGQGYRAAVLPEALASFMQTGHNLGQSAAGLLESRTWRTRRHAGDHLLAIWHRNLHRFRKLMAGSYGLRQVHTAIHLPGGQGRQEVSAVVGGSWNSMS